MIPDVFGLFFFGPPQLLSSLKDVLSTKLALGKELLRMACLKMEKKELFSLQLQFIHQFESDVMCFLNTIDSSKSQISC